VATTLETDNQYRLPRSVEPEHYALTFKVDIEASSFSGESRTQVRVYEPVSEIVLNAVELDIHGAELMGADGTALPGEITLDEGNERAIITLSGVAAPGTHSLHLTFSGAIGDRLRGIYRSDFTGGDGLARTLAATQFEPTDARRAFPCWDEPDRKATFTTTVIADEAMVVIANSEVVEVTDLGNGTKQVEFAETMRMSTYLVALVVGPLEVTEPVDVDGVPLRVACVPGKAHLADFALEIGAHALRFFSRYFGVPYPAGKLDMIALPDFAMGAMENLGAVTFRETALLVDPARATRLELERVADVVAHELAHMWFGDLVTMKWWNGIWLNEAFATFMELLCVDAFRPEWGRWVSFASSRAGAMSVDALATTRPIEFPVRNPAEAEGMFDVLTYQKGASVLRMLERYVGEDPFRTSIAAYIADHAYANTDTADLWDAVEAGTGEPARATMDSWIYQGGFPLVSAESLGNGQIRLSQKRFRYLDDDADTSSWQVPILLRASVGGAVARHRILLDEKSTVIDLGGDPDWLVVNESGWGFFRTRYDATLAGALRDHLSELDALERFGLVSDTAASTVAGATPVDELVALVALFADETDPTVWSAVLSALGYLDRAVNDVDRPALQALVQRLAGPALDRLGWQPASGEAERTRTLRATLIQALGVLGADETVAATAAETHTRFLTDPASVDPDVAGAVVAVVASRGDDDDYALFLERFRAASTPQQEMRYLFGLAAFEQPRLVERTFELARTEIRSQNAPLVIGRLVDDRQTGAQAWGLLTGHWDELVARYPENLVERMLEGIVALSTPDQAKAVHRFLDTHTVASRQRGIAQLRERLDIAVAFRQREAPRLGASLADA